MVFAILLLALVPDIQAESPDIPPTTCPYTENANYRPEIAFTVEGGSLQLVVSTSGLPLQTLDTQFLSYYPRNIYWGQNCRYIVAYNVWRPFEPYPRRFTSIYDTITGQRIFHSRREPWWFDILWSPTQEQFLIKSVTGMHLMSEALSEPVLLFTHFRHGNAMRYYEWDMARNQLLVNFWENSGYLMIYDIHTAAVLAAITNPEICSPTGLYYSKSTDERYLIVYTIRGEPACVTIYDQETRAVVAQVNAERLTALDASQIALSPDGHYLVIGILALRVWDLWNLPEVFEQRLPIHRHEGPIQTIQSVTFIDNTTLETVSNDGVQHWNLQSGLQIE
jgi:hypothetical protein